MNIKIVEVTDKKMLDELYNGAIAIEGLNESSFPDFMEWLEEVCGIVNHRCYKISGEVMNREYRLTGSNRYNNCLTICCVKFDDIKNIAPLILERYYVGARWFEDIVDNNLERENDY